MLWHEVMPPLLHLLQMLLQVILQAVLKLFRHTREFFNAATFSFAHPTSFCSRSHPRHQFPILPPRHFLFSVEGLALSALLLHSASDNTQLGPGAPHRFAKRELCWKFESRHSPDLREEECCLYHQHEHISRVPLQLLGHQEVFKVIKKGVSRNGVEFNTHVEVWQAEPKNSAISRRTCGTGWPTGRRTRCHETGHTLEMRKSRVGTRTVFSMWAATRWFVAVFCLFSSMLSSVLSPAQRCLVACLAADVLMRAIPIHASRVAILAHKFFTKYLPLLTRDGMRDGNQLFPATGAAVPCREQMGVLLTFETCANLFPDQCPVILTPPSHPLTKKPSQRTCHINTKGGERVFCGT